MEFADGHNIDANIKAFKLSAGYNQLTRTSIAKFCKTFSLSDQFQHTLQESFIAKARKISGQAFPEELQPVFYETLHPLVPDILKWAFSYKQSREILVLFERESSVVYIYPMKEVIKKLDNHMTFTPKGNILIGKSVVIQRKGGNGVHHKYISKDSLKHPCNNIQIKLRIKVFIEEMEDILLANYSI